MLNMKREFADFLRDNLPKALACTDVNSALQLLYDLIDDKGFAPPKYEEYNDFGRTAQKVYDDIYLSND